jgi:ABC-type Fe3+-siderophore transport system permease subunit
MKNESTGGMVCAIIGLILSIVSYFVCGWMSFIGLVLGIIALLIMERKGLAIATTIVSAVGAVLWIILLIVL